MDNKEHTERVTKVAYAAQSVTLYVSLYPWRLLRGVLDWEGLLESLLTLVFLSFCVSGCLSCHKVVRVVPFCCVVSYAVGTACASPLPCPPLEPPSAPTPPTPPRAL